MQKKIVSLMLILALFAALALQVSAVEVPDFDRKGSIAVAMNHDGWPVPGGSLTLYRAADVVENDGDYSYAYTADFAGCTIPVTELDSARLPQELARIAAAKRLPGTTQQMSWQGKVKFSDLQIGLYLLVQQEAAPGFAKINPFLVSVPQNDGGSYVYDVDTAPKNVPEPEPTKPTESKPTDPTKPTGGKLPQTGQNNWPVPVMASAGMLMIAAGLCVINSGKKKHDEA